MKSSPAAPTARRSRRLATGLVVLAACVGLAGCVPNNVPKSYDDQNGVVKDNFLATCTGRIPNESTTTLLATQSQCECAYGVFKDKVPYNGDDRGRVSGYPGDAPTFEDLENQLPKDLDKYNQLPASVRDAIQNCKASGQAGPVAPTATTPAAAATTTTGTTPP